MKKKIFPFLLLLFSFTLVNGQNKTVTGKVTSDEGEALAGVTVTLKDTRTIVTTNSSGEYSISVPSTGKEVLIFSFVGKEKKEITVGDRNTISVSLTNSTSRLNDVVVIGYGTVKRKDLTGAVASVSGKEIENAPVANVAQAMQGKLPGVSIVSQDGRPGADVAIRVRGGGSISQSNQPLILIDGVPGTLSDIPSDQVQSIDVLKDASSTAIYGARGANGVILVTTKGAKAGKTNVSANSYVKFNTPAKYLKALDPYDYLQYVWANAAANGSAYQTPFEQLYGLGANTGNNTGGIDSYRNLASDDIQRQVYNNSTSWNHGLTITGGTDKTKMLFSANYLDDEGMKINSFAKRANVAFKLAQKVFDNVTFSLDTRYTNDQDMDNEATTNGYGSLLSTAYQFRPIATSHILGDLDALNQGNIEQYGKNVMWDTYSPAARIGDYFPLSSSQNVRAIASLDWKIIKGLIYHTDFSMNTAWGQQKTWSGAVYNNYIDDATGDKLFAGDATYGKSDSWGLRWSNTLNYDFTINNSNKLNLLAGQEVYNSGGTSMSISANHFPANFDKQTAFAQINQYDQVAGSSTFSSSVATPNRINSYFGRANYSLLDKYLFTITFRADGSSKFAPTNRWGYFPAGAVAWKLTDEPFMKKVNWLDNLKVRASYGEVGNDGINANLWSQSWGSVTD